MSDKPLGPEWWQASDGTWHPPELHPSMLGDGPAPAAGLPIESGAVAAAPPMSVPPTLPESTAVRDPTSDPASCRAGRSLVVPDRSPAPVVQPAAVVVPAHVPPASVSPAAPVDDRPVATVEMPPLGGVPPRPVPSLDDVPNRPDPGGVLQQQTDIGPMFPDLFQQAVAGSRLADTITVHFADGEHRESLDVPDSSGPMADAHLLVSTAGTPPGEVGDFIGASAKKRRWHL